MASYVIKEFDHCQKEYFNDLPGFRICHTIGPDASGSTASHLHINRNRMVLYFLQGSGNLVVEDESQRIQPGDVIITDSSELFHCSIDPGVYHERISIHIDPLFWQKFPYDMSPIFRIFAGRKKGDGNLIPAEVVQSSGLGTAIEDLFAFIQQDSPHEDMLSLSKLIQLLTLLDSLSGAVNTPTHEETLLHQVLRYLNEHCTEDISVAQVAADFHITPSYLSHLFKRRTGLSPWNYVILRRLQQANTLMTNGVSAEDTCYRVGFDNYANFFRLYKKHTGITPSEFKKQRR